MPVPVNASMPEHLDLGPGFTLRVTALSATDGSVVTAVNVSNFSVLLDGENEATVDTLAYGPFMLVPGPGA